MQKLLSMVRTRRQRLAVRAGACAIIIAFAAGASPLPLGVAVPDGFDVSLYADDDIARDVFSLTVDSVGRVVVSGPGYVRILEDTDGDGQADTYKQFADGPKTGAQGLYFWERDLICVGDAGLMRYRDRDGDDRADGPPDLFLNIRAGGEHHAHAVRLGPDGWWYLVAGNYTGLTAAYATLPTSPVRAPEAGALLRLKPDWSGGEIVCDGYRNVYDFDFNRDGEALVFDSDGERDVSLPWYRPTRVMVAVPGSHAGWVSRHWKRPDDSFEMPEVVAAFGRGSPTGVVCYRHRQFPARYHNALFILDWTFGRVIAVSRRLDGASWTTESTPFMSGVGQFGFAPTDVDVGADGSLYVSVGGRGTRGGVYRVVYRGDGPSSGESPTASNPDSLIACLDAPQPLSSWSRVRWTPLARQLGRDRIVQAALDNGQSPERRTRAIEIAVELFGGLDSDSAGKLAHANSPEVRARAAWAVSRTDAVSSDAELYRPFLVDAHPFVVRMALQSLLGTACDLSPLSSEVVGQLDAPDRSVRKAASRLVPRLNGLAADRPVEITAGNRPLALLAYEFGRLGRTSAFDGDALHAALSVLTSTRDAEPRTEAVRVMQLALGDVGPGMAGRPVFESYTSRISLDEHEPTLGPLRSQLADLYPTGVRPLDIELSRLLAMVEPADGSLLDRILAQISADSNPVDDIHYLIVAARIPVGRTSDQQQRIAAALVSLEAKIAERGLNQDSHWDDRVAELYEQLARLDAGLNAAVVEQPKFGQPGHIIFLDGLSPELRRQAVSAFVRRIMVDPEYRWTNEVVFALGESDDPRHRQLIAAQYDNFAVRSAVLTILTESPTEADRPKFVDGLDSSQLEVLRACVAALETLSPTEEPREQFALLRTIRRLTSTNSELALRERVVKLLQRNMRREFGFVFGEQGFRPQDRIVRQWTQHLRERYPAEADVAFSTSREQMQEFSDLLAGVDWTVGDADRGARLFQVRACAHCHGGRRAIGPDLSGAARRFSRDDLFTDIALPNRVVSPQYQTTMIQTADGKSHTGLIIYESVDAIILRNSLNQTIRIGAEEISGRRVLSTSLMPTGLLQGLQPADLADLYAYLSTLGAPKTPPETSTGN